MAAPGKLNYDLDGQGLSFINSDDNKIIIRSDAPTATVNDSGIERPPVGSLSLAGQAPTVLGIIEPSTAALTFTGSVPVFDQPITVSLGTLSLSGKVPDLGQTISPSVGSLALTEYTPARWTGMQFEGFAPAAVGGGVITVSVGAMAFASDPPDVSSSSGSAIVKNPAKKSVVLAGQAPTVVVANVTLPTVGALTLQGRLTNVNDVVFPTTGSAAFTGYVPEPIVDGVTVIIEGPFEYGTFIRNTTATTDVPVNYTIDDRTGFKMKVKEELVKEYTGHMVRPDSLDKRSEQEFLRSRSENARGPQRPEPVGSERHIDEEYPDGVSVDDL